MDVTDPYSVNQETFLSHNPALLVSHDLFFGDIFLLEKGLFFFCSPPPPIRT